MRTSRIKVSSKGQVVIPAWVREALKLKAGDELLVRLEPGQPGGCVLTRGMTAAEIEKMLEPGYRWFEETGVDLVEELHEARRKTRMRERARRRP